MAIRIAKEKIMATAATIAIAGSLIIALTYYGSNLALKSNIDDEKLKSEQLLSEKLLLDKEIVQLREEIALQNGKNSEMDKLLASAEQKLAVKEKEIDGLYAENKKEKSAQKELNEIKKIRADLEFQITNYRTEIAGLSADINRLLSENNNLNKTISLLKDENSRLAMNIYFMQNTTSDDYLVQAFRGRHEDKLTVKAKRTKQLVVSFDVSGEISSDLQFTITMPSGKIIKSKEDKNISVGFVEQEILIGRSVNETDYITRRVRMTYASPEKLSGGFYMIDAYNTQAEHVGSCLINLR